MWKWVRDSNKQTKKTCACEGKRKQQHTRYEVRWNHPPPKKWESGTQRIDRRVRAHEKSSLQRKEKEPAPSKASFGSGWRKAEEGHVRPQHTHEHGQRKRTNQKDLKVRRFRLLTTFYCVLLLFSLTVFICRQIGFEILRGTATPPQRACLEGRLQTACVYVGRMKEMSSYMRA